MIWLVIYIFIGTVLVTTVTLSGKVKAYAEWKKIVRDLKNKRFSGRWWIQQALLPTIGFLIMSLTWPLLLYFWNADRLKKSRRDRREEETRFRIRRADLVARCSVAEVEIAEKIIDPMGAVPGLPFGHLNGAWVRFHDAKPEAAELWSFATEWEDYWGNFFERKGYVWRHQEQLHPWLLTFDVATNDVLGNSD